VIDRFRRVDFGRIEWAVTIDDPKTSVKPRTVNVVQTLLADSELLESFCDNHEETLEHRRIDPAPPEPPSQRTMTTPNAGTTRALSDSNQVSRVIGAIEVIRGMVGLVAGGYFCGSPRGRRA
jgi:hypothetical protein